VSEPASRFGKHLPDCETVNPGRRFCWGHH
jgi:hypothetical protein